MRRRVHCPSIWLTPLLLTLAFFAYGCSSYKGYHGTACSWEEATLVPQGIVIRRANSIEIPSSAKRVTVKYGENELWVADQSSSGQGFNAKPALRLVMIARPEQTYSISSRGHDGLICAWEMLPATNQPDFSRSYGCASR